MKPERTPTEAASATGSERGPVERRKILVVEDEPDILELVRVALEAEGFAVVGAGTGSSAGRSLDARGPPRSFST